MNNIAEIESLTDGADSAVAPLRPRPPAPSYKQIWAIGGGKGGVGKTLITANFAITLAKAGASVTLVDLDLGGANLPHLPWGGAEPAYPHRYFSRPIPKISKSFGDPPRSSANLSLGSAARRIKPSTWPTCLTRRSKKLLNKLRSLTSRIISSILDLGAGTTYNTLDFSSPPMWAFLVVLPEPTSIENAYRFIKSAFYRKLKNIEYLYDASARSWMPPMNRKNELGIRTPADLLRALEELHPEVGSKVQGRASAAST